MRTLLECAFKKIKIFSQVVRILYRNLAVGRYRITVVLGRSRPASVGVEVRTHIFVIGHIAVRKGYFLFSFLLIFHIPS